jgi:hypothetical protein
LQSRARSFAERFKFVDPAQMIQDPSDFGAFRTFIFLWVLRGRYSGCTQSGYEREPSPMQVGCILPVLTRSTVCAQWAALAA